MKKIKLLAVLLVAVMCLTMAFAALSASGAAVSTNVALEKTVQAGNGYTPTNITDGSTSGYFDAGFWSDKDGGEPFGTAGTCYVEIDLGKEYPIDKIKVVTLVSSSRIYNWEAYATTDNTADISTWTFIGEKDNDAVSSAEGTTVEFDVVTARYVRVYGTYHNENIGYHFSEVEVYATVEAELNKSKISVGPSPFGGMENWSSTSAYQGLATQLLVGINDTQLYNENDELFTLDGSDIRAGIENGTYTTQLVIDKTLTLDLAPSTYYDYGSGVLARFEPAKVGFYPVKGQTYEIRLNVLENGEVKYTGAGQFYCPMNPVRVYDGYQAPVYNDSPWYLTTSELNQGRLVVLPNNMDPVLFGAAGDNDRTDLSVRWEMYVNGVKYDVAVERNYTWNGKTQIMARAIILEAGFTPAFDQEYDITFKAYQASWPSKEEVLVATYNMKPLQLAEAMVSEVPYLYDIKAENGSASAAFADGTYTLTATGANEGYVFTGWYVDGELVSKEATYTFNAVDGADSTVVCQYADPATLPTYPITFVVDGVEYVVDTVEGFLPTFTGSTAKDSTFTTVYTFAGWDKEIVAATEAATYTAVYTESAYPVRVLNGGRYGSGMENWGGTVQLLYNVDGAELDFYGLFDNKYDYTWKLTWTWTDADGAHEQVQEVAPSTHYAWSGTAGFYRFEITKAVDTFVPVNGQIYNIDLDIYLGDYHAYTVDGNTTEYVINADPITHNFYTVTWMYDGEVEYTETVVEGATPVYAGSHVSFEDETYAYVPYVVGGTSAVTGDATYEIAYTKTDKRVLTLSSTFGGWENWPNSPNKGDYEAVTQLLIAVRNYKGEYPAALVESGYVWEITFDDGTTSSTHRMTPATWHGDYYLARFETCLAEDKFVPVKGTVYTISVKVYDGETLVGYCDGFTAAAVPMDPIVPAEPEPEFGFKVDEDGTRYYYEDGTFAKGWQTIDGKTYRFDGQGLLFEGESLVYGSQTFWFDADHAVREGLVLDADGYRFYIGGVRQYAWQDTDGDGEKDSYFYVSSYLRCEVDRMLFDGVASRRFYVYDAETGFMEKAQGFYTNENGTQYFVNGIGKYGWITPEGEIITDRPGVTVYGAYYFAYGDGINYYRVEDASKTIGGVTRVFDEDHLVVAYTGWALSRTTGNPNYYVEGELQQGWCLTPEGWVYLSRSENLANNVSYGDVFYEWRKIGGKVYYFRASTSNPAYTLITDAERALNYQGSRDVYIINQPADPTTATGADYYITNPPAGF